MNQPNPTQSDLQQLQQRIVCLEELFAHEERKVQQLNQVILQHRQLLDTLEKKLAILEHRFQWVAENSSANDNLPHEKPPHY